MALKTLKFLRYPGGKQRMLDFLFRYLPSREAIPRRFVEPFVGGGAVFLAVNPRRALLSDVNSELINLYQAIKESPTEVWRAYASFPSTKEGYYEIRDTASLSGDLVSDAARTLFLNRTCFKGMWRHNTAGRFNVGYGGQDRRWILSEDALNEISERLQSASLMVCDFEVIINACLEGDFIFADPPYRPGARELVNDLAWNERNENEIIGAEMKFTFTLNGRSVTGFIDRVERTPTGEYIVLDFKTGYPVESKKTIKQNIQMNVYALAVLDKFGSLPQRASLYYVKHDKMANYLPEPDHIELQRTRLSEMIDNVLLERFPGIPSYQTCRSCS